MATNLRVWREAQKEGEEFILPSGLHIKIKKYLSVLDLVSRGGLPAPLVGAAKEMAGGTFSTARTNWEEMENHLKVLNLVVAAALISPKVANEEKGEKPDDETILISELTVIERLLIYDEVVQMGDLVPFREEQGAGEAGSGNGKAERRSTKRVAGIRG